MLRRIPILFRSSLLTVPAILLFIFSSSGTAQAPPAISPLSLSARVVPGEKQDVLAVRLTLAMAPGVHVYTAPGKFELSYPVKEGLGSPRVVMPPARRFNGEEGIEGTAAVTLLFPYEGNPGKKWKLEGVLRYQACSDMICYPPAEATFTLSGVIPEGISPAPPGKREPAFPTAGPGAESASPFSRGLFAGIILSFVLGLTISLTPCIYPMIGITVALIGGAGASRRRTVFLTAVYVLGLSLVYAAAGVAVALAGSTVRDYLHAPWVLVTIGVVFVLLGLSMFDVLTIQTPSSWSGKIQQLTSRLRGSVPGIFLMGALSAFVVGPCVTGPVAGLILKTAETGDAIRGFVYFFALAWGMSALLFVAGAASGLLPRAGTWMERVKAAIGLVLIWAAFYFTRPLIGETVFLAATITAAALVLGALGLLELPHRTGGVRGVLRFAGGALLLGGVSWHAPRERDREERKASPTWTSKGWWRRATSPSFSTSLPRSAPTAGKSPGPFSGNRR